MSLAHKISENNRERKFELFMEMIKPGPGTTILDVGFSEREYSKNDNFIEKKYAYPQNITALGVDTPSEFCKRYPLVRAIQYDGGIFPFADQQFDVCWSNAVIEHVGASDRQVQFLKEIRRVSKVAFLTTPNRWFPIEVHTRFPFLHYLPKKVFDKLVILMGKGWASGDYMHLLSPSEARTLLKRAGITAYDVVCNRLFGLTMDFIIRF